MPVQLPIKPTNCVWSFRDGAVNLALPAAINLRGAKFSSDRSFHDHDHYKNRHGDLYVPCNYVAGFRPSGPVIPAGHPILDQLRSDIRLRYEYRFGFAGRFPGFDMRHQYFLLSPRGSKLQGLFKQERYSQEELVEIVQGNVLMGGGVMGIFFDWVNEFGRMFPQNLEERSVEMSVM